MKRFFYVLIINVIFFVSASNIKLIAEEFSYDVTDYELTSNSSVAIGDYVYFESDGKVFQVDATNPKNPGDPVELSSIVGMDLESYGNNLYTFEFTQTGVKLRIYDASNPQSVTYRGAYDFDKFGYYRLKQRGNYLFIGQDEGDNEYGYVYVIDVSNPANPTKVGEKQIDASKSDGFIDLVVPENSNYLYVITKIYFYTYNATNLSNIILREQRRPFTTTLNFSIVTVGNDLFVGTKKAIKRYDVSTPTASVFKGTFVLNKSAYDIRYDGRHLVVIDSNTVRYLEITDLSGTNKKKGDEIQEDPILSDYGTVQLSENVFKVAINDNSSLFTQEGGDYYWEYKSNSGGKLKYVEIIKPIDKVTLTTEVQPNEAGIDSCKVIPEGVNRYDRGTDITITAQPAPGWKFKEWTGDLTGTANPQTLKMTTDKGVVGHFEKSEKAVLTLSVETNDEATCLCYIGNYNTIARINISVDEVDDWDVIALTVNTSGPKKPIKKALLYDGDNKIAESDYDVGEMTFSFSKTIQKGGQLSLFLKYEFDPIYMFCPTTELYKFQITTDVGYLNAKPVSVTEYQKLPETEQKSGYKVLYCVERDEEKVNFEECFFADIYSALNHPNLKDGETLQICADGVYSNHEEINITKNNLELICYTPLSERRQATIIAQINVKEGTTFNNLTIQSPNPKSEEVYGIYMPDDVKKCIIKNCTFEQINSAVVGAGELEKFIFSFNTIKDCKNGLDINVISNNNQDIQIYENKFISGMNRLRGNGIIFKDNEVDLESSKTDIPSFIFYGNSNKINNNKFKSLYAKEFDNHYYIYLKGDSNNVDTNDFKFGNGAIKIENTKNNSINSNSFYKFKNSVNILLSENINISNNKFENGGERDLDIVSSKNIIVKSNDFIFDDDREPNSQNIFSAIYSNSGSDITVENCKFDLDINSIAIDADELQSLFIENSVFDLCSLGVFGSNLEAVYIRESNFSNCANSGLLLDNVVRGTIYNNTFKTNNIGSYIKNTGSLEIVNNSFTANEIGLKTENSDELEIRGNNFVGNGVDQGTAGSKKELIQNDEKCAMLLDGMGGNLFKNNIKNNFNAGIICKNNSNPNVNNNNFAGNEGSALNNEDANVKINAKNNFWGDGSGPSGEGTGSGDKVGENIDFSDWITDPMALVAFASSDVLLASSAKKDSVMIYINNWLKYDDIVDLSLTQDLDWSVTLDSNYVQLQDSLGATLKLYVDIPADAPDNIIKVHAISRNNASWKDSVEILVTNYVPELSTISISDENIELYPEDEYTFKADGFDQRQERMEIEVNWFATGGSIDENGLYKAGETPGEYLVIAEEKSKGIKDTVNVTILEPINVKELNDDEKIEFIEIYPNPISETAKAVFEIKGCSSLSFEILDIMGRKVFGYSNDSLGDGIYEIPLDLSMFSNGIYIYHFKNGMNQKSGKIQIIK